MVQTFTRRGLLAMMLTASAFISATPAVDAAISVQDKADLTRVESYLNGIKSLDAKFVQIAPDGSLSDGKLYLLRPGRIRFEYAPPSPILVVADGTRSEERRVG